ncbi:MAG: ClbS/DfsB family four-helix bundle protein [Pseudomonadota bacterium]
MPAENREALLAVTRKEWAKLDALLEAFDAEAALAPDEDGWSVRDVVVHRAHWIELFLHWRAEGLAGREAPKPAPGYKWNELKRYNADLRARRAQTSWAAACAELRDAAARLLAALEAEDDAALYGGPMPGGGNPWTTGRWAEASGASHYRSAAKFLRARRRALEGG